jgi:prophage regulatory protein
MSKILRLPEVIQRTGLSKSSIYAFVSEGTFPQSISLGARAVGWSESELNSWIEQRIADSQRKSQGDI